MLREGHGPYFWSCSGTASQALFLVPLQSATTSHAGEVVSMPMIALASHRHPRIVAHGRPQVTFSFLCLRRGATALASLQVTYERMRFVLKDLGRSDEQAGRPLLDVAFALRPPAFAATPPAWQPMSGRDLDATQQQAVSLALAAKDIALIHGPPGVLQLPFAPWLVSLEIHLGWCLWRHTFQGCGAGRLLFVWKSASGC